MNKSEEIMKAIEQRLNAAFNGEATVKVGWPSVYIEEITQWPLVCISPAISGANYSGKAIKDVLSWHIQLVDSIDVYGADEVANRLLSFLKLLRASLVAQKSDDRLGTWQGLLTQQPVEDREARFIDPQPREPYAGLSFILTTTTSENLELQP